MPHDDSNADFLKRADAAFPMPQRELDRLAQRRWILRYARNGSVGAEIGVFRGHFSEIICQTVSPRKLYLIDPWTKLGERFGWGKAYTANDTLPTAQARDEAQARVATFENVETVLVEDHFPACRGSLAEKLDFAYLDASHDYAATLKELSALSPQMAPDGIILGDDWQINPAHQHHGVFHAVQDYTRHEPWQIVAAGPGGQWALARR
ncbi:class I SAM-dependent methyltransferase [Roseibaca sp. V10]|uniref:Class I SAM-dependent methyltransferase n=1 Tax=Roseinatronobacter domitianus TaxID=2940293 RepID=A0ABT0M4K7_9RHOB|nr:class I SAM-dependent methyltransferase [Roseibaca domitiana]MCL1629793.1 class I SAM-dependent methyltransferase [Roseibaca domitiana]